MAGGVRCDKQAIDEVRRAYSPCPVPTGCECPNCGENDVDLLLLDDADNVACLVCGHMYELDI